MSGAVLHTAAGDLDVLEGLLRLPLRGNWVAHLEVSSGIASSGAASLDLTHEDGSADTFSGTIRRANVLTGADLAQVTLVGGAGALLGEVPPCEHVAGATTLPAGLIASGIISAAGERLEPGVEAALDALQLRRWTRMRMPARDALDVLAHGLGLGWRATPSGAIWIGFETWPEVDGAAYYIGGDPSDGTVLYAPDGAPLLPGTTIDGMLAVEVAYRIGKQAIRAEVRSALAGDPVRAPDLTLYRSPYAGRVVAQRADGTLDITPDDPRLPDLLAVDFKLGIAGARVVIPAGARVRVGFEGADPRGAFAAGLDQDPSASAAFALVGDDVDLGTLTGTAGGNPVTFLLAGGAPTTSVHLRGKVTGPGHPYLRGVTS